MSGAVIIYLVLYALLVGGVVLGGFVLHLQQSKKSSEEAKICAQEITVLVPFRNEQDRLDALLKSILQSKQLPKKFIFIDDHSEDNSCDIIKNRLEGFPVEILSLPDGVTGKKRALRAGIEQCSTEYILTFDADISFQENYFKAIERLDQADMYVLPAILLGKSGEELFYELDVALANALNAGLSGMSRPIFSSGANFLFKRSAFDEVDDFASHEHMASGDDTYLLRDFRRNNKDIRLESDLSVAVHTDTPHSFKEFIDQRLRWVGKTTDIGDPLATLVAGGQFLLAIAFFALLIYFAVLGNWFNVTVLFFSKIGLDLVFFAPFFLRTKRLATWCLIPVYELLFPIYSLLIGVLMLMYRPKWKGRAIQS